MPEFCRFCGTRAASATKDSLGRIHHIFECGAEWFELNSGQVFPRKDCPKQKAMLELMDWVNTRR